jgi:hypothetical protein
MYPSETERFRLQFVEISHISIVSYAVLVDFYDGLFSKCHIS